MPSKKQKPKAEPKAKPKIDVQIVMDRDDLELLGREFATIALVVRAIEKHPSDAHRARILAYVSDYFGQPPAGKARWMKKDYVVVPQTLSQWQSV